MTRLRRVIGVTDSLARIIRETRYVAHNRLQERGRIPAGFDSAELAQGYPGLALSKRPGGARRSPKGGLFMASS